METKCTEAGKMAQHLRTLAAQPKNPGLIPRTHMTAHNSLQLQDQGTWCAYLATAGTKQEYGP